MFHNNPRHVIISSTDLLSFRSRESKVPDNPGYCLEGEVRNAPFLLSNTNNSFPSSTWRLGLRRKQAGDKSLRSPTAINRSWPVYSALEFSVNCVVEGRCRQTPFEIESVDVGNYTEFNMTLTIMGQHAWETWNVTEYPAVT